MLTIEKDEKAEQIFIHASPEKLRWLASRLEAIDVHKQVLSQKI